jgi:hypothetical protein
MIIHGSMRRKADTRMKVRNLRIIVERKTSYIILDYRKMGLIDRITMEESCFCDSKPLSSSSLQYFHHLTVLLFPESDKNRYMIHLGIYFFISSRTNIYHIICDKSYIEFFLYLSDASGKRSFSFFDPTSEHSPFHSIFFDISAILEEYFSAISLDKSNYRYISVFHRS